MSLGVLNNLSALYAENNLNNSNNSLNTVLQQLSSGSKINSGADDAAGLSLVNGLQANQMALTQSKTNSAEGVGLLQVADGALSQVTSLLNRAVTLATEASNGTLNSSQDTAANQEYQSILSEISNIGSTTTYNDAAVFNSNTNIYTGDASTTGASIDNLNIRSLSSSNLGDSGGVMAYSNGANNTFVDLSKTGTLATVGDGFTNATSSMTVDYMASGVGGAVVQKTATISVGATTGYADTAQGMIQAINGAGLGLTATFTTAAQAGTAAVAAAKGAGGTAADTGIEINGPGAGVGTSATPLPGQVGALAIVGGSAASQTDVLSGTLNLKSAAGANITLTLGGAGTDTLANLATTLTNDGFTVVTTNSGTTHAGLTITTANSSQSAITGASLTDTASGTLTYTASAGGYFTTGVTNVGGGTSGNDIADVATGQTQGAGSAFTADTNSVGGTATISYSDAAGTNLSGTDLSNQNDAQAALTALNTAITAVSAQDGYVGAQINTLNAVSQVLSTQQENVQSAQNAVQATDYASATSNMSKYEILSQTGIAALAQANTVQQEVMKLLQ
jgi:flagellin